LRQLNRLLAIGLGYFAGYIGGPRLVPLLRGHADYPDFILVVVCGTAIGLVTFGVVIALGRVAFRRTADQQSGLVRLGYGLSGAFIGVLFGLLTLWVLAISVKLLGTVAEAQLPPRVASAADVRRPAGASMEESDQPAPAAQPKSPPALILALAGFKRSLASSIPGSILSSADPIPRETYDVLGKIAHVVSSQQSIERFMEFPGARMLSEHPHFAKLRDDPGVVDIVRRGSYLELFHHPLVVNALNDPQFRAELGKFRLTEALNYALKKN
jgi:hypothetical protein